MSAPHVPTIVTTDLSSEQNLPHVDHRAANDVSDTAPNVEHPTTPPAVHFQTSSPPKDHFLSPASPTLLRVPSGGSNTSSTIYSHNDRPASPEIFTVPPSPTLSTLSDGSGAPNKTTLALRDNQPTQHDGIGSLSLLGPTGTSHHRRKDSAATFASTSHSVEGTEPDHRSTTPAPSFTTHVASHDDPVPPKQKATVSSPENADANAPPHDSLPDDESVNNIDSSYFTLQPRRLASLVDPKNLPRLIQMGGLDGVIKGLGTHRTRGLDAKALAPLASSNTEGSGSSASTAGARASQGTGGGDAGEKTAVPSTAGSERGAQSGAGSPFEADVEERKRVFGINALPARKSKTLLQLMWLALKDRVLILLCISAVVSLALGFYQDFGAKHPKIACPDTGLLECEEPSVDWVEGVAIMVAVIIVVVVGSLNDWQKERQFRKLNDQKEDRGVKVIRNGNEQIINIKDVLVGDIGLLEPGEVIPCDGIFLTGHGVKCDESGATGESDMIKKSTFEECEEEYQALLGKGGVEETRKAKRDCFVLSGAKVNEGVGQYLVIAVGPHSFNGRILMALRGETENTPLQLKLNNLAELIAKLGSAAGAILFTALMIKFFVQLGTDPHRSANVKAQSFIQILIISVTLIVVAVPEGLPLAVTLALAFATKRMTKEQLLVRVLSSCEIMANASVVCTDKTGTLTQNVMTVVAGSLGVNAKFVRQLQDHQDRTNANEEQGSASSTSNPRGDFSIDQASLNDVMNGPLRQLFSDAITINSTAFEDINPETKVLEFVGSKTETALLRFNKELGWRDYKESREVAEIVQAVPFSSERKSMGSVVKISDKRWRIYLKGASEILTKLCTRHVVVQSPNSTEQLPEDEVVTSQIGSSARENISRTIIFYANQTLRTIALCYRDFESWPPAGMRIVDGQVSYDDLTKDLTLIAITGIEDPLRAGVTQAVDDCRTAGVAVKMCTGDNILTARSIATQCGIYTAGGIIMEGPSFRQLNDRDRFEVVPRLQVLARSSPEDKKILVDTLKKLGEIVGVTGDGANDAPALSHAHVGFSMGIAGTEVAKEASDIVMMDDNFASIVSAIMWGRCVNDAVRKFLQFQISVNITAVITTFVTAVASGKEESVLTAVQLLWINIIMDTFAALALATDPASRALLNRKPDRKTAPLFTIPMAKQIIGQSMYQCIVILIFHFAGNEIFGYKGLSEVKTRKATAELNTLVFNAFVFCQIFNSINCRNITNDLNCFRGILKNYYFMVITVLEIVVQIIIVFVGGAAFQVTPINGRDWGISIALGIAALPLGALIRLIPDEPVERLFIKLRIMKDPASILPTQSPESESEEKIAWNPAIEKVRDNLAAFSNIRGGRVRGSSFVGKSRSAQLDEADIQLPSLLTMVPTLVAATVGAGWAPQSGGSLSDPAGHDPSKSSAALFAGSFQIHPDTDPKDPLYSKWGAGRGGSAA